MGNNLPAEQFIACGSMTARCLVIKADKADQYPDHGKEYDVIDTELSTRGQTIPRGNENPKETRRSESIGDAGWQNTGKPVYMENGRFLRFNSCRCDARCETRVFLCEGVSRPVVRQAASSSSSSSTHRSVYLHRYARPGNPGDWF